MNDTSVMANANIETLEIFQMLSFEAQHDFLSDWSHWHHVPLVRLDPPAGTGDAFNSLQTDAVLVHFQYPHVANVIPETAALNQLQTTRANRAISLSESTKRAK
jgi:hypothetical protein